MVNNLDVPIRLASVLLMSNAQITMAEIQSLPFVNNREEANAVAQNLMSVFGPGYRIEVASGIGRADVKLRLETAQPSAASHTMSTHRTRSGRRPGRLQSFRQQLGSVTAWPGVAVDDAVQEQPEAQRAVPV